MAYSSKTDAINKLTNGFVDNDSLVLYPSDNSFNTNTIWYKDSAKTQFVPAGNYVYTTNYRTLWITIGSNGKFSATPELLFTTNPDSTFADDTIFSHQTNTRSKHYLTDATIASNILTDNNWSVNTYPGYSKQWVCNSGPRNTTALTSINLSDMKGFDLLFYVGAYDPANNFYVSGKMSTILVHVGQDISTTTVSIEGIYTKNYFRRPDYFFSKPGINKTTFFKRLPSVFKIKNIRGTEKSLEIMETYIHDVLQYDKTTVRTSTRRNRSFIGEESIVFTDTSAFVSKGYTNTSYGITNVNGIDFDQPYLISNPFPRIWGVGYDQSSLDHNVKLTALYLSMLYSDFTGSYTNSGITVNFAQANPYQWTCTPFSGTGYTNEGPASLFYYAFQNKAKCWHWDFEHFWILGYNEGAVTGVLESARQGRALAVTNGVLSSNNPKISWYANGVYMNNNIQYFDSVTTSNLTSSQMYSDYNDYYINGTKAKEALAYYWSPLYNYADLFESQFVSNYLNNYNSKFYFYRMLHQYDITNKLLQAKLGTNHAVKIQSYIFQTFETVSGATMQFAVKDKNGSGINQTHKPDIPPDFWQSLGAWSFGYADGTFMWDFGNWNIEYYQDLDDIFDQVQYHKNDFSGVDWFYWSQYAMYQNKDIIEANTQWSYVSQSKGGGLFTSGWENYPITSYVYQRPLICAKFNTAGTEALILAINPFNNGYTKSTTSIQLYGGYTMNIDMWGNYTTILRTSVTSIPPSP